MKIILKHKLLIIGAITGAAGGFAYYSFIGCANGTCSITSDPLNSTLYGALIGALFLNLFKNNKQ